MEEEAAEFDTATQSGNQQRQSALREEMRRTGAAELAAARANVAQSPRAGWRRGP